MIMFVFQSFLSSDLLIYRESEKMSGAEAYLDEYDEYNVECDKYINTSSGKRRSKREVAEHTNHFDPSGHTRKIVEKLVNTEKNKKVAPSAPAKSTSESE